jgi:hypothetical protein
VKCSADELVRASLTTHRLRWSGYGEHLTPIKHVIGEGGVLYKLYKNWFLPAFQLPTLL